jgi:hypothetical protein
MSNWINAEGEIEGSASTLRSPDRPAAPQAETRFKGGWVSGSSGEITPDITAGDIALRPNDDPSNGLMATARTQAGSMVMGRSPRGNDVILIEGMPVALNVAAMLGYVTRNPDGSFSDKEASEALKDPTAGAKAQTGKAPEDTKTGTDEVTFGEAGEAALRELMESQQHHPGNMFRTVDSVLQTGNLDATAIERMASIAGVEPADMRAKVETIWQGAHDAATNIMADAGIENDDAFEAFITADSRRKSDFTEAARNFFVNGSPEGLHAIAEAYLPSMDRYEGARVKEMLTEAGWQFSEKAGGGINVMVNGQPVSWEVAVKQKIITFSRR